MLGKQWCMLQTIMLPFIRGEGRASCTEYAKQGGRRAADPVEHWSMGQFSRFCFSQRQDTASQQTGLSTELSWSWGPATHWALFCLSEKHQLLTPGSYWDPNSTEPATQRESPAALDIDIANLLSASTDIVPLGYITCWFNPCTIPCSLRVVCFSSSKEQHLTCTLWKTIIC